MTDFKKIKQNNFNLALIGLVLALLVVLSLIFVGPMTLSTSFSLQFEGIERGINPDNTRFDYQELTSGPVIAAVFKYSGIEYKPEYDPYFQVTPVLPEGIVDRIKKNRISGEDYSYFPNEFVIKIKPNPSIGLTNDVMQTIATNYKAGYETYFIDKYTFPFMDLDAQTGNYDLSSYDYPEYARLFQSDYNRMISYLNILERDDPEFVGPEGLTFRDLKEGIKLSNRLDVQKMDSLIDMYQLSKDKEKLKIKYLYMIRRYTLEKDKDYGTYQVSQELLNIVKQNDSKVLIPGVAGETMSISVVNDTYDEIASKATNAQVNSVNINEEIAYIQRKLNELEAPTQSLVKISQARKDVDVMATGLKDTISNWVSRIKTNSVAYFDYKYDNAVTQVYNLHITRMLSPLKAVILAGFLWFVITSVLVTLNRRSKPKKRANSYKHVSE